MLIKIPGDDWVDPTRIIALYIHKHRVIIVGESGKPLLEVACDDDEAQAVADRIAARINEALTPEARR